MDFFNGKEASLKHGLEISAETVTFGMVLIDPVRGLKIIAFVPIPTSIVVEVLIWRSFLELLTK